MKQNIFYILLFLTTSSLVCMDHQEICQADESEESQFITEILLGSEVPQRILDTYNINFGCKTNLAATEVDFSDKELVIYVQEDVLSDTRLGKPHFGRIKEAKTDALVTYLRNHKFSSYKIVVDVEETTSVIRPLAYIRALPVSLKSSLKANLYRENTQKENS